MPVKDEVLSAALKIGEENADQVIMYALRVRILQSVVQEAVGLLKTGKIDAARAVLERTLHENR